MPVEIDWYVPDYILMMRLTGEIGLADVEKLSSFSSKLINENPDAMIHALIDIRQMGRLKLGLKEIIDTYSVFSDDNRLPGWSLMIGQMNPLINFVFSAMGQTFKFKFRNFKTMPEALQFLKDIDPRLVAVAMPEDDAGQPSSSAENL